jgi:hypothetical protein
MLWGDGRRDTGGHYNGPDQRAHGSHGFEIVASDASLRPTPTS